MSTFDHISTAIVNLALAAINSVAGGVFMGVMARHAMEAQAGKHPMFGALLGNKLFIGGFLYFIATGAAAYMHWEGPTAYALAALIGIAGPELLLALLFARLKAQGLISDIPGTDEGAK